MTFTNQQLPIMSSDNPGDGVDLTTKTTEISNGQTGVVVNYYTSQGDANSQNQRQLDQSPFTTNHLD
jgi:archaellin